VKLVVGGESRWVGGECRRREGGESRRGCVASEEEGGECQL
jgi:hypothetical protein